MALKMLTQMKTDNVGRDKDEISIEFGNQTTRQSTYLFSFYYVISPLEDTNNYDMVPDFKEIMLYQSNKTFIHIKKPLIVCKC